MVRLEFRAFFVVLAVLFGGASILQPNHYPPWPAFYSEYLGFVSFFFILLAFFSRSTLYFSRSVVFFFVGAFIPFFQWVGGGVFFFGDAFLACAYLLGFSSALAIGQSAVLVGSAARGLFLAAWSLIIVSIISVWMALCQWLSVGEVLPFLTLPVGSRPYANLGQSNNLATILSMALIALLYLYEKRHIYSVVGVILACFLFFGVALTQSRTPWLASLAVLIFWSMRAQQCGARISWRIILLWVLLYSFFVAALPYLSDVLLLPSTTPLQRMQSLHRLDLWWQLFHAVLQGPIWGYGWTQVSVAQIDVSLVYPVQLMTEHSHNILLDFLIWNGPVLGSLLIAVLVVWLVSLGLSVRTVGSMCCILAVGVVLVHGMVEFPLEYAFFLLPIGLLLGIVIGECVDAPRLAVPRCLAMAGAGILLVGLGWVWCEYRIVEEDHRLMRFETAGIGSLKAEHVAPNVLLLTQLRDFISYARTHDLENMSAEQLAWMRKIAHRYPYSPSLIRYSLALALNGRPKEADQQLLILRSLYGKAPYEATVQAFKALCDSYPQLRELTILVPSKQDLLNP